MENTGPHHPIWFKAWRVGFGWTPCSPEGWFVSIVAAIALIGGDWGILMLSARLVGGFDVLLPPLPIWAAVAAIIGWNALVLAPTLWLCWRTGERPHWRWGGKTRTRSKSRD